MTPYDVPSLLLLQKEICINVDSYVCVEGRGVVDTEGFYLPKLDKWAAVWTQPGR